MPPSMCATRYFARRSPPPAWAAWRLSKPRSSWQRKRMPRRCGRPSRRCVGASGGLEGNQMSMDWDKLRVFHAVAEAGSFTHAGEALNLSQSAVSRQISALEQELKVPLFHRHAPGLILTEQGEVLYRTAHEVYMKLEATRSQLSDSREKPNGELRVT